MFPAGCSIVFFLQRYLIWVIVITGELVQKYLAGGCKHKIGVTGHTRPLTSASSHIDSLCHLSLAQLFIPTCWVNTILLAGMAEAGLHVTMTRRLMQEQAGHGLATILHGIPLCCCSHDGDQTGVLQQ